MAEEMLRRGKPVFDGSYNDFLDDDQHLQIECDCGIILQCKVLKEEKEEEEKEEEEMKTEAPAGDDDDDGWVEQPTSPASPLIPRDETLKPCDEALKPCNIDKMDETDGWITGYFINTVKTAVLHLLGATIKKLRKLQCYGCEVDHPSQRQHACLYPDDDNYMHTNFYTIIKMLCTPSFIPAIQRLLELRRIHSSDARVGAVAETLLFELKSEKRVSETIDKMYAELVAEDDKEELEQLRKVDRRWAGDD